MSERIKEESKNVFWQQSSVSREDREARRGHRGCVLWFTGLSASGKSTLASQVEQRLFDEGYFTYMSWTATTCDTASVRTLGFSHEDRTENIRRVGEVAKLFAEAGAIVATAFISPYRTDRNHVRVTS